MTVASSNDRGKKQGFSGFGFKTVMFGLTVVMLSLGVARASPYASGLTNKGSRVISFCINEGGGNVTITYEDGTTNSNYNGQTTGTNLASGCYGFALGSHSNYSISVHKAGAGVPTLINRSLPFDPRGIDVNKHPASPYFGRVYASQRGVGIMVMNSDLSQVFSTARTGSQSWVPGNDYSPYRLFVADDDYLMIGDASEGASSHAGVYRADPDVASCQLFLGPTGETNGLAQGVFGTIQSRPILLGNPANEPATLMLVDGDFSAAGGYNSILVYTNITLDGLPWENSPDLQGPEIGPNFSAETLSANGSPSLQIGPNGYIYAGAYGENCSRPLLDIFANDPLGGFWEIWNSYYAFNTADYFRATVNGLTCGTVDLAVSPDGNYVAGVSIANWFVICPLNNGIPELGGLFIIAPASNAGEANGVAFDAADNLYMSSSGLGLVQSWSLGLTTTAITTGNANGAIAFQLLAPPPTTSAIVITGIGNTVVMGTNNLTIQFTTTNVCDNAVSFVLQSADDVSPGLFLDVPVASITQVSAGTNQRCFQANVSSTTREQFYRIRRQ